MLSRRDLFAGVLGAAAAALPKRAGSAKPELPAFPPLHDEVVRRAFEEPRGPFETGDWIKYTDGTGTLYACPLGSQRRGIGGARGARGPLASAWRGHHPPSSH